MEALNKLVAYVETLDRQSFRLHILGCLGGVCLAAMLLLYGIYQSKDELIQRLQALNNLAVKGCALIETNRRINQDEKRLKQQLELKRGFSIQAFFEQFCRDQNITPEAGWSTRTESVSDMFDEIILPASFKNLTSDKLVAVLDALNKEEIVYLKELQIRNANNRKIGVSITLATKSCKTNLGD